MKLFIKRGASFIDGFTIYNDKAEPIYVAAVEAAPSLHISIVDTEGKQISSIKFNTFMLNYFTVRCGRRFYALVPCIDKRFAFAIYGSTFRFIGSLSDGRFSMLTSDGKVVMTQQKCWTQHGDGYEIEIMDEQYKSFMLSVALCADIYLALSESKPVLT